MVSQTAVFTGQAIPRGLHVRMNLQTGIKEAKLLDPEEDAPTPGGQYAQLNQDSSQRGEFPDAFAPRAGEDGNETWEPF